MQYDAITALIEWMKKLPTDRSSLVLLTKDVMLTKPRFIGIELWEGTYVIAAQQIERTLNNYQIMYVVDVSADGKLSIRFPNLNGLFSGRVVNELHDAGVDVRPHSEAEFMTEYIRPFCSPAGTPIHEVLQKMGYASYDKYRTREGEIPVCTKELTLAFAEPRLVGLTDISDVWDTTVPPEKTEYYRRPIHKWNDMEDGSDSFRSAVTGNNIYDVLFEVSSYMANGTSYSEALKKTFVRRLNDAPASKRCMEAEALQVLDLRRRSIEWARRQLQGPLGVKACLRANKEISTKRAQIGEDVSCRDILKIYFRNGKNSEMQEFPLTVCCGNWDPSAKNPIGDVNGAFGSVFLSLTRPDKTPITKSLRSLGAGKLFPADLLAVSMTESVDQSPKALTKLLIPISEIAAIKTVHDVPIYQA